jgi:hypothetical protein
MDRKIQLAGVSIEVAHPTTGRISTMQNLRRIVLAEAKHQLALNVDLLEMLQDGTPLEMLRPYHHGEG